MKRLTILISIMAALAAPAVAQAMTGSPTMTPGGSDMAAPADASRMMAAADDMSYEALKKSNMLADSRMGSQLRKAKSTGMKVLFRDLKSAQALAARNPTVLFFAADWCPSCQADLKDINANGRRLGKVDIVVVDYDKSRDLKARYGITVQDTFVQIGKDGSKLAIWNGGGVDGILAHLVAGM